jgi:hypothetical protein
MTKSESSVSPQREENLSNMKTTQCSETCDDGETKRATSDQDDTYQEQSTTKVVLLLVSIMMTMFLVALDRTIISTV